MGWLRCKWAWAKENPLFWANLVLMAISSLLIFVWTGPGLATGPSDLRLRTWGMLLQLLGVFTVWFDLTSTARKFGKGGFVRHTLVWLRALFGRSVVIGGAAGAIGVAGMRARMKGRRPIQPNAPLPDRVATLETNVEKIDEDLDAAYREIDKRADEVDAKIKAESGERDRSIREVKTSLEDATTGNFSALAFGAAWLAIGVVLATWAPEIVKVVGGQWDEVWRAL